MTAYQLVQQQAEDEGLWFVAGYCSEAFLQQELRKLHAAVERDHDRLANPAIGEAIDLVKADMASFQSHYPAPIAQAITLIADTLTSLRESGTK